MAEQFNWECGPSPEAWQALQQAKDEDFPTTYGGQAWRAAWRLMKVAKEQPERFASWDGWTRDELASEVVADLDLTGFMFGWAINALRSMIELPPVADGATVTIGGGDDSGNAGVFPGSAEQSLRRVLGGGEQNDGSQ